MCLDSKNYFEKIEKPFETQSRGIKREMKKEEVGNIKKIKKNEEPEEELEVEPEEEEEEPQEETVVIEFTEHIDSVFDNNEEEEEEMDEAFMNVETLEEAEEYIVGDNLELLPAETGERARNRKHCKFCDKTFASDGHLSRHVDSFHLGETPNRHYRCEKCDLDFPNASAIKEHREKEHKLLPGYVNCEFCDQAYQKHQRSAHMKEFHENQCRYCLKKLPTSGTLRIHMKTHADLKNFMCHLCDQKFFSDKVLQFHLEWHKKVKTKKWVCDECGEELLRENSLLKHKRLKHSNQKKNEFVCGYCDKVCRSKQHHQSHILKHIYGPKQDSDENAMIEKEVEVEVYDEDDLPDYIEVIKKPVLKPPVVREVVIEEHYQEEN